MAGLFPRTLSAALRRVAGPYPVVYLTGSRQSGKTTLACATFPDFAYVNLEDLQRRAAVKEDPHGFLRSVVGEAGVTSRPMPCASPRAPRRSTSTVR